MQPAVTTQRRYLAYLLRLWLSDNGGEPAWRGSLEDPSGSRIGFGDAQSLFEYLRQEMVTPSSTANDPEA